MHNARSGERESNADSPHSGCKRLRSACLVDMSDEEDAPGLVDWLASADSDDSEWLVEM
jgi:hypothetical protein